MITHIDKGTFYSLPSLQVIVLSNNKLTNLPNDLFLRNHNMLILHFSRNTFHTLPSHALSHVNNVKKILLDSGCHIRRLNFLGYSPENIWKLSLISNSVARITATDFQPLSKFRIESFDLSKNKLTSLPDHVFTYLILLKQFRLSYNYFSQLNFSSFIGMASLQKLSVDYCGVRDILGFSDLMNGRQVIPPLIELIMHDNKISSFPSKVFMGFDSLALLDLRQSRIRYLANDSFQGLVSLKTLDLQNNLLKSVSPEIFKHMPNLTVLTLSSNKFVTVSPKQLQSIKKLRHLRMSRSDISKIQAEIWNLPALVTLDLSENKFDSLRKTFFLGLNNLSKLILYNNPIRHGAQNVSHS